MFNFSQPQEKNKTSVLELAKKIVQEQKQEPKASGYEPTINKLISQIATNRPEYTPKKEYGVSDIFSDVTKAYGGETGKGTDFLGAIGTGIAGAANYLGTTQGRKLLTGLMSPGTATKFSEMTDIREKQKREDEQRRQQYIQQEQMNYDNFARQLLQDEMKSQRSKEGMAQQFDYQKYLKSLGIMSEQKMQQEQLKNRVDLKLLEYMKSGESDMKKEINKELIKRSAEGYIYYDHLPENIKEKIPKSAIVSIGTKDELVKMVKPAKTITDTKFSIVSKAARDANLILNDISEGKLSRKDFIAAATTPTKKLTGDLQQLSAKADLITEAFVRSLSGAAVLPDEITRLRDLFSINKFDTVDTIKYKLNRTIEIANEMRVLAMYGASPEDVQIMAEDYRKYHTEKINEMYGTETKNPALDYERNYGTTGTGM